MAKSVLISPIVAIVQTSKIWRLIAIAASFAAFIIALESFVLFVLGKFSLWLGDISANAAGDFLQFVGYVLNFDLLYVIFTAYAFSFLTFTITVFSLKVLSLIFSFFPEAVSAVKHLLDSLTGD